MTQDEFKQAWEQNGDRLVTFHPETVAPLQLPEEDRAFLIYPGLPESAAPFLDFATKNCIEIPSAAIVWKAGDEFRHYRVIGSNGFGDPICVDEKSSGSIVYLRHDDEMKPSFMNSNVRCLAFSLLAFREIVLESQKLVGDDAYLAGRIPDELVDKFIVQMDQIDPPAINSESFWFRSIMGEGI